VEALEFSALGWAVFEGVDEFLHPASANSIAIRKNPVLG
jgi:hypothetical protein